MNKKRYHIIADLEYIQGHLRYGHLKGVVELTDEELARLKKDPQFAKELCMDIEVDDYRVDDVGPVSDLTVFEVDEDGDTTLREVDMSKP